MWLHTTSLSQLSPVDTNYRAQSRFAIQLTFSMVLKSQISVWAASLFQFTSVVVCPTIIPTQCVLWLLSAVSIAAIGGEGHVQWPMVQNYHHVLLQTTKLADILLYQFVFKTYVDVSVPATFCKQRVWNVREKNLSIICTWLAPSHACGVTRHVRLFIGRRLQCICLHTELSTSYF